MTVSRACYCTREDVKLAPDFTETARGNSRIDRAIQSASELIDSAMHRVFYPFDGTYKFDWPNWSFAPPWKLSFGRWDLVSATQVQSPAGTTIALANVIFRPVNRKPGWPFTGLELDRSTGAVFGAGSTPQNAIQVTGTWGFTADTDTAGTLAAAVNSTATTVTVSDASLMGVGDLLIVDSERLLVTERAATATGLTQSGAGCTAASAADSALATTGSGTINLGEVLLLDQERVLVTDVTGGVATVRRAWDGTVLATHSAAAVNAYRVLTVARGQLGTTAATHSNGAAVSRHRPPGPIRDLGIAVAVNQVLQETSGYARTVGEADNARPAPGFALAGLWDKAYAAYGRKARTRAA